MSIKQIIIKRSGGNEITVIEFSDEQTKKDETRPIAYTPDRQLALIGLCDDVESMLTQQEAISHGIGITTEQVDDMFLKVHESLSEVRAQFAEWLNIQRAEAPEPQEIKNADGA